MVEELQAEAAVRAGSPEGVLLLIKLLLKEADEIDWRSSDAPRKYFLLLRAYVLAKRQKRQMSHLKNGEDLYTGYTNSDTRSSHYETIRGLRDEIKERRAEARQYAAQWIPPHKLKPLKQYAGVHMGIRYNEIDEHYLDAFAHGRISMPSESAMAYRQQSLRESAFSRKYEQTHGGMHTSSGGTYPYQYHEKKDHLLEQ